MSEDDLDDAEIPTEDEAPDELENDAVEENDAVDESETGLQVGDDGPQEGTGRVTSGGRKPASEVIRELRRERQETQRERDEIRQQLQALQQHRNQPDPRIQQMEAERLSMMGPDEKLEYYRQQDNARFAQLEQRLMFQQADMVDRSNYLALKASNPIAQKYQSDVERIVEAERAAGRNVSREVALKFAIGEKILANASRTATRQGKQAKARVTAQTTSPRTAAGAPRDARGASDDMRALERSLKDVQI